MRTFTTKQSAEILGKDISTFTALKKRGHYKPTIDAGTTGRRDGWSLADLFKIKVIFDLSEAGLPLKYASAVIKTLVPREDIIEKWATNSNPEYFPMLRIVRTGADFSSSFHYALELPKDLDWLETVDEVRQISLKKAAVEIYNKSLTIENS